MISKKKLLGATLVTAAALAFSTAPITSAFAHGQHGEVKCYGLNGCEGQGKCGASQGKNKCKGQGVVMKKSKSECEKVGGTLTPPKHTKK